MALCDECKKAITGHYISNAKEDDGKKYCSQVCFDKAHPCSICGKGAKGKGKNGKLYCSECWEGKGKLEDLFGENSTKGTGSSLDNSKSSNRNLGFLIIFLFIALVCLIIFLKRRFGKKKK